MERIDDELRCRIAASKAELDGMRPLASALLAAIRAPYDFELTQTSNAIEGNTLTLRETREVIEHGVTIGGKPLKDHLEAQDHHRALGYMYDLAGGTEAIGERTIRELHSLVVNRSQSAIAGVYSPAKRIVAGSASTFPHPLHVPGLMDEFGRSLSLVEPTPEAAFDAHFRLTNIHPFADGNGRTARLLMNLVLVRGGHRPIAVRPADRPEYLDALEAASVEGDMRPFDRLMHRRLAETMDDYVAVLRETHRNQREFEERARNDDAALATQAAFLRGRSGPGLG